MVEQNARRCLQICDRGYVLDQGRDAYTGTGRELAKDPKVIALYLGTLAEDVEEARTDKPAAGHEHDKAAGHEHPHHVHQDGVHVDEKP
jgi:branched-chain amino acid transport system ATP-binding protein